MSFERTLERGRVLRAIGRCDVAGTEQLLEVLGLERGKRMTLWKMLSRLVAEGHAARRGRGEYFLSGSP